VGHCTSISPVAEQPQFETNEFVAMVTVEHDLTCKMFDYTNAALLLNVLPLTPTSPADSILINPATMIFSVNVFLFMLI